MAGDSTPASDLRFSCTRCGNCCTNHGEHTYLYVMDEDVQVMASHLGEDEDAFRAQHVAVEDGFQHLVSSGERCTFLDSRGQCTVYSVRPVQCRTWPFWEENLKPGSWEGPVQEVCPGTRGEAGAPVPMEEARAIAEATEAWYVREGDWRERLAPLGFMEDSLPPAVRLLLEGGPE